MDERRIDKAIQLVFTVIALLMAYDYGSRQAAHECAEQRLDVAIQELAPPTQGAQP